MYTRLLLGFDACSSFRLTFASSQTACLHMRHFLIHSEVHSLPSYPAAGTVCGHDGRAVIVLYRKDCCFSSQAADAKRILYYRSA